MTNETQINEWLESKTITKAQAQKMIADVNERGKEEKSSKLITAISIIGVILLGIGTILFVASNWDQISNITKVIILVGSTFAAYYTGYLLKYQKGQSPKVGAALIFLGTLLFGASIFLIAQIYNINANSHSLILIWLIGILPLVYAFNSQPIALLSSLLFLTWIGFFIFRNGRFSEHIIAILPTIYISAGTLLFSIGGIHYFKPELSKIARIIRIIGIKAAMISLFLLTFNFFSGYGGNYWFSSPRVIANLSSQTVTGIVLFSAISIIGLFVNMFFNPAKSKINTIENGTALGVLGFTLIFFFFPVASTLYTVLFNLIFVGLVLFLIYVGYEKYDQKMANMGIYWISIFVFAKYIDFFWGLMDRSIFFLVGGIILVLGGLAMERKRRQIKADLTKINN